MWVHAQEPTQRLIASPRLPSPANAYALPNIEVPRFDANWDSIWMEYQGEWPLGLLITPQVLGRCGTGCVRPRCLAYGAPVRPSEGWHARARVRF